MSTHEQIAARFFGQAFAEHPQFLGTGHSTSLCVRDDTALRYEQPARRHPSLHTRGFGPVAVALSTRTGQQVWLFNADTGARRGATADQELARQACRMYGEGRLTLFLPFSALHRSGILADTIEPIDVQPERYDEHRHVAPTLDAVPRQYRQVWTGSGYTDIEPDSDDGLYRWTTREHFLGAMLFHAAYRPDDWIHREDRRMPEADFLSAFDQQEPGRNYFLCQLPADGGHPYTVRTALDALKPVEVTEAEADGRQVLRQGDMFAVPTDLTTRQVKRLGVHTRRGAPTPDGHGFSRNQLHRTAHTASDVVTCPDGRTYARGVLRHEPGLTTVRRQPDHRQVRLGPAWHLVVRNTVPLGPDGRPRAWQVTGHVD